MLRARSVIIVIAYVCLFISCQPDQRRPSSPTADAKFHHSLPAGVALREEHNGRIIPRAVQFHPERPDHPGLVALRERENLAEVVKAGTDEWSRMKLLCSWVNSQFPMSVPDPYPNWDANQILDMIRAGRTGGFCAQYAVVMVQGCLALGWPARILDVKGQAPDSGGHISVEVWSNQFNSWLLLDPTFDASFERDGRPLSALEVHQALVDGQAGEIKVVRGTGRNGKHNSGGPDAKLAENFFHLACDLRNDHLSRPLSFWDRADGYLSFADQFTDGQPIIFRAITSDPADFNFPLNQVEALLMPGPAPGRLICSIRTNMENPAALDIATVAGQWQRHNLSALPDGDPDLHFALSLLHGHVINYAWHLAPGDNELRLRAVDHNGNAGPVTYLKISMTVVAH